MSLQTEQQSADAARQCYNVLNCFFYAPRIVEFFFKLSYMRTTTSRGYAGLWFYCQKNPVRHNEVERSVTLVAVVVGEKKNPKKPTNHQDVV